MGKILALDFGKKRTGIAITDHLQMIASGLTTVDTNALVKFLKDYTGKEKVTLFVVGLPKKMDNTPSENEDFIQSFLKDLQKHFPNIPVERYDERLTSKMAFQTMIDSNLSKKQRRNKSTIDKISATIILQSYLYAKKG